MSNYAEATTKILNSLVEEVHENAIQNLQIIKNSVQQQIRIVDFLNNITMDTWRVEHMINRVIIHYTNFLTGIQMLMDGRLSIYLLPKQDLENTLKDVQEDLEKSEKGKFFRLVYEEAEFYYRKGAFVFARGEENLFITLQLPVTNIHSKFIVYQIVYHKLTLHDGMKHSLELEDKIYGIAISESKDLYYEMDEVEVKTLNQYEHSRQRRIFKWTNVNRA